MPTNKPKPGLAWWAAALISLSLALLASAILYMSDVLLTRSAGWSPPLSFLQTNRSWVFVMVMALVLFGLIGNLLARGYAPPPADNLSDEARTASTPDVPSLWQGARTPLLIFLLLASAIGGMDYLVYADQRHALQKATTNELLSIADQKVKEVSHWLAERRMDAEFIARDPFITQTVRHWLSAPVPAEEDGPLLETWLNDLRETFDYSAVMLLDVDGQVRLGLGAARIHPYRQALARQAMASGQVVLSDLYWRQEVVGGPIDLTLIAPLGRGLTGKDQAIGALVLKIDPEQYFFPLIQSWPTASSSAETLLVRREDDELLCLNELRHRQGTALQLRLPLASRQLPAAGAIQGESGVMEGLDYRQVPVLSVARPIPDTPWFLIAKIDAEEVYAPLRTLMRLVAVMASILIMAAGAGTMLWWHQQNARFVAENYRRELERQALVQHFDYLAKYANDIILLMDSQGRLMEVNDRAVAAYGYPYKELLGLNIRDLCASESRALIAEQISQAAHPDGLVFETVHQCKDGACFPVEVSSRRIDIGGQTFLQSIIRDISERRQAEERLRYQLHLVQSIADQAAESIFVADARGRVTFLNAEAERTFGFPAEELTGQILHLKLHHHYPDGRLFPMSECPMVQVYTVGKAVRNHEDVFFHKDGLPVAVECSNAPLEIDGQRIGTVLMVRNITERKRAEQALRRSEERFRTIFDAVNDAIFIHDPTSGTILDVNRTVGEMYGYTREEARQIDVETLSMGEPPYTQQDALQWINKAVAGHPQLFEWRAKDKSGRLFWVEVNMRQAVIDDQNRLLVTVRDITARKQAEEALRASAAQLAWTQQLARLGSWESDLIARREYWSDETYRILGYEPRAFEPLRDSLLSHAHPDDRQRISSAFARALKREAPYDLTFRIVRPSGEERILQSQGEGIFDDNGQAVAIKGAVQDITERRRIERQLREQERQLIQADKLAALGTLVSGVAHEINNPNNLILLNTQLLAEAWADVGSILDCCQGETKDWLLAGLPYAEMRETLPTLIQDIHQGALRIQKIVTDLKDFVRPNAITPGTEFSLNETIRHALNLLSHAIKKMTDHLRVDLAENLPLLFGNAQQLEQVVVNLIMNALEALPDKTHGLSLVTDLNLEDNCIELRVADEGIGITRENLNRICEPFFTTKQHQQGTGLGLFIAYKLVAAHQGTLSFQSEPGRGTVALVRLPLLAKRPPQSVDNSLQDIIPSA